MKLTWNTFFLLFALHLHGSVAGDDSLHARPEDAGNDNAPAFVSSDSLPPGLRDNPGKPLKAQFKKESKARFQRVPRGNSMKIRDLDGKLINLKKANRINLFRPDMYEEDGDHAVHTATGRNFFLGSYFFQDDEISVTFSINEDGELMSARVEARREFGDEAEPVGTKDDVPQPRSPGQNFQRVRDNGEDLLLGYFDDDLDLGDLNARLSFGGAVEADEEDMQEFMMGQHQPPMRRTKPGERHLLFGKITEPGAAFGRTCQTWDYVTMGVLVDDEFLDMYDDGSNSFPPPFLIRFADIQTGIAQIFWEDLCIQVFIEHVELSDSAWQSKSLRDHSGWALWQFGAHVSQNYGSYPSDLWHLFSGLDYSDGKAGAAFKRYCKSGLPFGVSGLGFTNSLRLQQVTVAHQIGNNLNAADLSPNRGYVMDTDINPAPNGIAYWQSYFEMYFFIRDHPTCGEGESWW